MIRKDLIECLGCIMMPRGKMKFKDFMGDYQYTRKDGVLVMAEVRPAFRVVVHADDSQMGEIFFMNSKQLTFRMDTQEWEKIEDVDDGPEILPLRKIGDPEPEPKRTPK